MEDESIPNESITATSYIEDYFPWYARINIARSNGLGAAWCTNITSGNQSLTVSTKLWFLLCFNSNFNSKYRSTFEFYLLNNLVRPIFNKFRQYFDVCFIKDTLFYSPSMDSQFLNKFMCGFSFGKLLFWITFLYIIHSTLYPQHSTVKRNKVSTKHFKTSSKWVLRA